MVWMFILWKRSSELCHQHGFECDSRRLNRQLVSLWYSRPHSGCCFSWQNSTVPVLLRRISGNWLHRGGSPSVFADGAHIAITGRDNRPRRIGKILTQLCHPEDFTSKSITDYKHVPVIYEYNWIELNRIWKLNALELRSTTCCRHLGMGLLDEIECFFFVVHAHCAPWDVGIHTEYTQRISPVRRPKTHYGSSKRRHACYRDLP